MHRAAYSALGLTGWTYDAIEVDGAGLPELVRGVGPEWVGFSVTMPGKSAAAAIADSVSERVRRLGVANTLIHRGDTWFAENTDVDGVIGALRAAGAPSPRRALLVGGGGSALAALAGVAEMGLTSVTVAGRQLSSTAAALKLAAELGLEFAHCDVDEASIKAVASSVDLVIAMVPAGAADHLADVLAEVPVLFDAIYHPWPTPLAAAGGPHRITVTGLDMLLHQAFRQVELMTGFPAPVAIMRDALRAASKVKLPLPIPS